jgi:hypothetical protein
VEKYYNLYIVLYFIMGNILAIHAPSNTQNWGGTDKSKEKKFASFLNRVLIDGKYTKHPNRNLKRGCCLGIVGDVDDGRENLPSNHGLQVPIQNIGRKDEEGKVVFTTRGITTKDVEINAIIKQKIDEHTNNQLILDSKSAVIKRVIFDEYDNECLFDGKPYNHAKSTMDDATTTACDELYLSFCKDQISDNCIIDNKFNANILGCSVNNSDGDVLFPNSEIGYNPAHSYPEDCSCINGKFGDSYNAGGLNIFTRPKPSDNTHVVHPLHFDTACDERAMTKNAYATKSHRVRRAQGTTICANSIVVETVGDVLMDGVVMENDCDSEPSLQPPSNNADDNEPSVQTPSNNADDANDDDDDDDDDDNDDDDDDDDDDGWTNYYIIGGVLCCICLIIMAIIMVMMMG